MALPAELLQNPGSTPFWDTQRVHDLLSDGGTTQTLRSTERLLEKAQWLPAALKQDDLRDELGRALTGLVASGIEANAKRKRLHSFFVQTGSLEDGRHGAPNHNIDTSGA